MQELRPELPVIVRTVDDSELDKLLDAGATEVVPEVLEGSLMLASHSLLLLGVPLNRVLNAHPHASARSATASSAASSTARPTPRMPPTTCSRGCIRSCCQSRAYAQCGRTLAELELGDARRGDRRAPARRRARSARTKDWRFEAGDVVVLLGRPEQLAAGGTAASKR